MKTKDKYPNLNKGDAGKKLAEKFKTKEQRIALCEAWCKHLANGFSKESFLLCDPQTFRRYMAKYPQDFDTQKINEAERASRRFWEQLGIEGTRGKEVKIEVKRKQNGEVRTTTQGFNATAWIFNMKNRFGWKDKIELGGGTQNKTEIIVHDEKSAKNLQKLIE